ncbi:MAG: hypothetical protein LBE03_00635 [Candidatus Nomurabacteria bacterium]|jgi:dihydrofolate synthase/folylpolyglutamate synthase|nr:hypothetical protein [Candidatus Nomurabacteria bacterium]
MSFEELEKQIYAFLAETKIFAKGDQKLKRMQDLMSSLGNPQNKLKVLHIAGTSGKTSTSYFVAEFLRQAGQKVGLTVSPHVVDVRERAQINMAVLEKEVYVKEMAEFFGLVKSGNQRPSYMEFFMGFFYYLAEKMKLDYAVVETGLGGLYDASNVVTLPDKICLITDIFYDHTEILGDTLTEIARQKAGIIQPNNQVFMFEQPSEVLQEVVGTANQKRALMHFVEDEYFNISPRFQSRNASLALAAVKFALSRDKKERLTQAQINQSLKITIPARAEEFTYQGKCVVIDGAHNPQKLATFARHIIGKYGNKKVALIVAFGSNKAASLHENLQKLLLLSHSITLTTFRDLSVETSFRESLDIKVVQKVARNNGFFDIKVIKNPVEALRETAKSDSEVIVVVGSFFLLNHIRPVLANCA